MSVYPEDYKKIVLEDLNNNVGLYIPVKASVIERLITREIQIEKIHPNPEDEFSDENIGPNFEIIGNYERDIREAIFKNEDIFKEPLSVNKIAGGDYMLLNGHHRWMAAIRTGVKKVPVQLTNVVSEDSISEFLKNTNGKMCVSFDLDEVLLTDGSKLACDKRLMWPFSKLYQKTLRKNSGLLVNELRDMGCDVWVYTGEFYSEEYIKLLFRLHGAKVDGVINGLSKAKSRKNIQKLFSDKYDISVHIDNESVMCVNTKTKDYEVEDIGEDEISWASEIMLHLKKMEMIKKLVENSSDK